MITATDENLATEIRETLEKLNSLIVNATHNNGLGVEVDVINYGTLGYREVTPRINCKIYKEVL